MHANKKELITLSLVGDVYFGPQAGQHIRNKGKSRLACQLWKATQKADLTILNLEGPLTRHRHAATNKRFNFRSSPETVCLFDATKAVGMANNHILDYGDQGLKDTCEVLDANDVPWAGAGKNLTEAQKPLILEANGLRVGVLFAADSRYNPAGKDTPGTNPAIPNMIRKTVHALNHKVNFVVVSFHMGIEYTSVPTPFMRALAAICLEEGARVVQFHHAHRISGVSRDNRGVVLWGCGNYAFSTKRPPSRLSDYGGAAWNISVDRNTGGVVAVDYGPIAFDTHGFPVPLGPCDAQSIHRMIEGWSRRINGARALWLWRVLSHVSPAYFRSSLPNYLYMARRQGVHSVVKSILSTIKTQWCQGRSLFF